MTNSKNSRYLKTVTHYAKKCGLLRRFIVYRYIDVVSSMRGTEDIAYLNLARRQCIQLMQKHRRTFQSDVQYTTQKWWGTRNLKVLKVLTTPNRSIRKNKIKIKKLKKATNNKKLKIKKQKNLIKTKTLKNLTSDKNKLKTKRKKKKSKRNKHQRIQFYYDRQEIKILLYKPILKIAKKGNVKIQKKEERKTPTIKKTKIPTIKKIKIPTIKKIKIPTIKKTKTPTIKKTTGLLFKKIRLTFKKTKIIPTIAKTRTSILPPNKIKTIAKTKPHISKKKKTPIFKKKNTNPFTIKKIPSKKKKARTIMKKKKTQRITKTKTQTIRKNKTTKIAIKKKYPNWVVNLLGTPSKSKLANFDHYLYNRIFKKNIRNYTKNRFYRRKFKKLIQKIRKRAYALKKIKKKYSVIKFARIHIRLRRRNTFLTCIARRNRTIAKISAGTLKYDGRKKALPFAREQIARKFAHKLLRKNYRVIDIHFVAKMGRFYRYIVKAFVNANLLIRMLKIKKLHSHGHVRPKKAKRK